MRMSDAETQHFLPLIIIDYITKSLLLKDFQTIQPLAALEEIMAAQSQRLKKELQLQLATEKKVSVSASRHNSIKSVTSELWRRSTLANIYD